MEKEQILTVLKEKIGNTSLSDRSLTTYVENNLPSEDPNDEYWAKHVNVIKSLQGQFSADVAAQVNAFKTKWAEEHPTAPEPPKPVTPQAPPAQENKELEELKSQFKALQEQLARKEKEGNVVAMRTQVANKAEELGVSNKALWEDAARLAKLDENGGVEELTVATKSLYEANLKRYMGDGAAPYGATNTPPNPEIAKTALDNYFKNKPGFGGK